MALVSFRSPSGVEVPCALRYCTWSALTPALRKRRRPWSGAGRPRWARSCGTRRRSCRSRRPRRRSWRRAPWRARTLRAPARRRPRPARSRRGPCPRGARPSWGRRCGWTARAPRRSRRCPAARRVDSAPPATITSASPYSIMRADRPMACRPVVQAVTTAMFGPLKPYLIDTWPEIMLMIDAGTKKGEMRRGPRLTSSACVSSIIGRPPMPEPMLHADARAPVRRPARRRWAGRCPPPPGRPRPARGG